MRTPGFATLCGHAGDQPHRYLGGASPPIYQNSLFQAEDTEAFIERGQRYPEVYDYTRVANPTTDVLEAKLAALEGAEAARCFGSGMAAISAAILHCVEAGAHVVAVDSAYGPTRNLLTSYLPRFGVSTTYIAGDDPQQFADAIRPNTRLFYLESPSSLVFRIQDLRAVTSLARERDILTIADNSWATPRFQNPIALGVDLVVHSATKYLGGHSDLVGGVALGSAARIAEMKANEGCLLGGILDPFASWLLLRGVRTLGVRMERHQSSGFAVARFLQSHPRVRVVHYPGLERHPQHDLARFQMRGCSGLLSFELKDGSREAACRFVDALRYFGIAVSWGGFESLAIPVAFGSDSGEPVWGARISVGLESIEDLLEDLDQGLAA
jgi:cystathionine beta-lyase